MARRTAISGGSAVGLIQKKGIHMIGDERLPRPLAPCFRGVYESVLQFGARVSF